MPTRGRASPHSLLTYVNYPPTEYLELGCFDVCAFNVYLHREADLRAYLARLQHIAGSRPLLLAEAGADSIREGTDGQAAITAMHIRAAFEEGLCGAMAFSWTDEWWRGGNQIDDWAFGLVDADRRPKPALAAVSAAFADGAVPGSDARNVAQGSVVVCAYNAARHARRLPDSLGRLNYPDFEVIVVNDGSSDDTGDIARRYPGVRLIEMPNGGLSAARNIGLSAATGEIVAYTDADVRVDRDWLTYLVQPLLSSDVVGSGGPNIVPPDDPFVAQCVARAPAARRTCCSTIASPSTSPAATWLSGAKRCSPSAGSTRSICAPATTWTCAGGCRRRASGSGSRRRRSCGTTTALGQGLLAPAGRVRRGRGVARGPPPREVHTAARCCGRAASTARCRSSARCRAAASTPASGERRHFPPSTRRACPQRNCCRIRPRGKCSRRSLSLRAQRPLPTATSA